MSLQDIAVALSTVTVLIVVVVFLFLHRPGVDRALDRVRSLQLPNGTKVVFGSDGRRIATGGSRRRPAHSASPQAVTLDGVWYQFEAIATRHPREAVHQSWITIRAASQQLAVRYGVPPTRNTAIRVELLQRAGALSPQAVAELHALRTRYYDVRDRPEALTPRGAHDYVRAAADASRALQ